MFNDPFSHWLGKVWHPAVVLVQALAALFAAKEVVRIVFVEGAGHGGCSFFIAKPSVKDDATTIMADIPLRVNPAQDIRQIKILRLNRKNNRGLYVNNATGFSSRDRREVIDRADDIAVGNAPYIVRRRLRRGWRLQDALTTAQA